MSPPAVRVVAAFIVSAERTRVLVQQRPAGRPRSLLWELPGGKVEAGESDDAALRREAREELGVDLEVGLERFQTCHAYPDVTVDLHVYDARILAGAPRPRAGQALREANFEELGQLDFCEADRTLVERLLKGASEGSGRIEL